MYDMDKETTEGFINVTEAAAEVVEKGAAKTYQAVENGVTKTYSAIEKGVVGAYQAVENAVVGAFEKVSDAFVGKVLCREGESVEEAKERMAGEQAQREEDNRRRMGQHTAQGSSVAQQSLENSRRIAQESLQASQNAAKKP